MTAAIGAARPGAPRAVGSRVRRAARRVTHASSVDLGLAVVIAAGVAFRLWGLGGSRLSYDESFTAMAGRLPINRLFSYLTTHDSHPPLDYLIHAPFARAGASEFWFRFPSAMCSIAALVLLAVWLRPRGRVAVVATALLAVSAFEIAHGRDARMYAELEVLGVGLAMTADRWLRTPERSTAVLAGVLTLTGLFTHVSMLLLAFGLFTLAGLRRDRAAWEWRAAIVLPVAVWAATWGPHFLVQARGGHSTWIPSTSLSTLTNAVAHAVSLRAGAAAVVVLAIAAGAVILFRRDRDLGRVWCAAFAIPIAIAAVAGFFEPVVLDRTFTLMAWAPAVAIAFLIDAVMRRQRVLGAVLAVATVALLVPDAVTVTTASSGPTAPLNALDARIRPGDVVAVRPASKAPELEWSLAVRHDTTGHRVEVNGLPSTFALRMGTAPATGRVWYLDWRAHHGPFPRTVAPDCAATWKWGGTHIDCLMGHRIEVADASA